ncbi:MAG: hypothetical protein RMK18_06080, partial [Armatimonadota bacterium]|nr:hypothetical protein [Armatimonadota bacterium]MDW8025416.1 hypothetical protein [Armatimonadota bacterium]
MRIIWSISAILLLSLFCLALNSIGVNQDILKIVGEVTIINGNASGIARYGDHLYMVMNESTRPLLVYDISEPKRPKLLHYLPAPGWPMRCRVIGKWLWTVHGNGEGFFDLTDPANPRFIGIPDINANEGPNLRRLERGKLFIVHPNLTYITCATEDTLFYGYHDRDEKGNIVRRDVQIYDISDPGKPRLLNSLKDAGEPFQLEGKLLFVAKDGIKIYDVSQRDNPNLLTHIQPQMFEQLEKEGFGFASAAAYDEIGKRIFVAIKRGARNFLGVAKGPFEGG